MFSSCEVVCSVVTYTVKKSITFPSCQHKSWVVFNLWLDQMKIGKIGILLFWSDHTLKTTQFLLYITDFALHITVQNPIEASTVCIRLIETYNAICCDLISYRQQLHPKIYNFLNTSIQPKGWCRIASIGKQYRLHSITNLLAVCSKSHGFTCNQSEAKSI